MNLNRRNWLQYMMAAGSFAAVAPFLIRRSLAMGSGIPAQGFIKMEGKVLLNDKPAAVGMPVKPGDRIATAENGIAVFVLERDAYLLRANSRLELGPAMTAIKSGDVVIENVSSLALLVGKMLSVFGKGEKKVKLPTATLGIRGTAIYAEADAVRSYLCTCYGTVEIQSNNNPQVTETVVTKRHDMPRYINAAGIKLIEKAPMINHTNDELYMLEALVNRLPAFHQPGEQGGNPY